MTQKHTPGPWIVNNNHSGKTVRIESDASGYPNDGWIVVSEMNGPDAQENAKLIAASPLMYRALKDLMMALQGKSFNSATTLALSNAAYAIAKAEGR